MTEATQMDGPDLGTGVQFSKLEDGKMLLGHVEGEAVLLVRRAEEVFAIGATCTHYGAPLADGLLVGDSVRCPWHHACFSLRTGEAVRAPALKPLACWRVEQRDGRVYVHARREAATRPPSPLTPGQPRAIVIVGGGAAGDAAAEMLRREGYSGRVTLLSADSSLPCDRPNLSKGYLAGNAAEESNLLRAVDFYREHDIEVALNARVERIDTTRRNLKLADGSDLGYDALLLATGAEPVRLDVPGAEHPHVHYLRTLADSRELLAGAKAARHAVVIGASFIGLEVAASLRAHAIEVHVVGRETCPMEKVLGREVGQFIRGLHESHGVTFHLGTTPERIDERGVHLANGETLQADLVVVGVGVRPAVALAQRAGLAVDGGVLVDACLETSVAGIFAAGDIARWPDPLTGERLRVEHWAVAQRQGQTAARNLLGRRERFEAVPFFWTEQYDFGLAYVGHAERFDRVQIDGSLEARDCTMAYWRDGRKLAVAVIHRDLEGVRAEVEFEAIIAAAMTRNAGSHEQHEGPVQ